MKKFISLIFAILLTFGAVSCVGEGEVPVETTAEVIETLPETEPEPTTVGLLNENGKALYRIVRPDEGSDGVKQLGIDLKKALKELTGGDFSITTDFLMPNEDVGEICEILIGATNRPESVEACTGLTADEYLIRVIGSKIVIAGGSDLMTARAVEAFLAMLSAENGFVLDKNTDIKQNIERGAFLVALTNQGNSHLEVYDISEGKLDDGSLV
ncbi:MAG: hypothetical protein II319_05945, partial [Clostridia bacterium]|nr:hypothetical protein [Clostridia bacterium]